MPWWKMIASMSLDLNWKVKYVNKCLLYFVNKIYWYSPSVTSSGKFYLMDTISVILRMKIRQVNKSQTRTIHKQHWPNREVLWDLYLVGWDGLNCETNWKISLFLYVWNFHLLLSWSDQIKDNAWHCFTWFTLQIKWIWIS